MDMLWFLQSQEGDWQVQSGSIQELDDEMRMIWIRDASLLPA